MQYFWFLILFCLIAQEVTSTAVRDDDLIVQLITPSGRIQGHTLQSDKGIDFYAFQEIPYAVPPIGENRFQEPKPAEGWEGILNTTQNTKICMQPVMSSSAVTSSLEDLGITEDCLYLNVYSPVKPGSASSLPVYLWIHGGGYLIGDGTIGAANPAFLIDYDIVIVSINYRLGAFGFLTIDDENLPANLGLKDQQFAIQWVTKNIQLFGGNPKKITIGGVSAGASSVSYQLLTKKNRDLVSGFIQQSGTALGMTTYQPNFNNTAFQLGKLLNSSFSSTSSKDLREVLLKASADDILTYQEQAVSDLTNGVMSDLLWAPIIENDRNSNAIITSNMLQDFIDGNFNRVPSIVGFNSEEALGFVTEPVEGLEARAKKYDDDISLLVTTKINVTDREQVGRELKPIYTNSTFVEDIGGFIRFSSSVGFTTPSLKQIEESAKYAPVYVYELAYSEDLSPYPGTENSAHASDIIYFWGWSPNGQGQVNSTIRSQLLTLWSNFIKYQDPTPQIDEVIGVNWPKVEQGQDIVYLNINRTLEVRSNPKQYSEIKNVLNKYITEPYILY